jgi:hypothetical protein
MLKVQILREQAANSAGGDQLAFPYPVIAPLHLDGLVVSVLMLAMISSVVPFLNLRAGLRPIRSYILTQQKQHRMRFNKILAQ